MELVYSAFSILLTILLILFTALKVGRRSKTNYANSNLPPGPWKLPLIGNLHQLVFSVPHRRLRDLAKIHGPLMHLQLGEVSTVVVSSPEFAKEVMKTHDVIFASRPQTLVTEIMFYDSTGIAFSPYGEYWRRLRKICTLELLSTKRVQSFRRIREEEVSNLVDWIATTAGSTINFTEKVMSLMYSITSKTAFGKKCKDEELFKSIVHQFLPVVGGFNTADLFPSIKLLQSISGIRSQVERIHQEADKILENIINDHKKAKATSNNYNNERDEDLVDVLLKFQEQGDLDLPLTTDNIKAVIYLVVKLLPQQ